jgi:hypothetical protein
MCRWLGPEPLNKLIYLAVGINLRGKDLANQPDEGKLN